MEMGKFCGSAQNSAARGKRKTVVPIDTGNHCKIYAVFKCLMLCFVLCVDLC